MNRKDIGGIAVIVALIVIVGVLSSFRDDRGTVSVYDINVGDEIAGMKVVSVGPERPENTTFSLGQNARIKFEGEAQLTGDMYWSEILSTYCFTVDESSYGRLPLLIEEAKKEQFCFSPFSLLNVDLSEQQEVVIDNYVISIYPSEGSNTADLVRFVEPNKF